MLFAGSDTWVAMLKVRVRSDDSESDGMVASALNRVPLEKTIAASVASCACVSCACASVAPPVAGTAPAEPEYPSSERLEILDAFPSFLSCVPRWRWPVERTNDSFPAELNRIVRSGRPS